MRVGTGGVGPQQPRILGDHTTPVLCCWFVEDNGKGKHGYAAADGRRGYLPPQGGGLFNSIQEMRNAMSKQKIRTANVEPNYDDEVPQGWRIRSLTDNEMADLLR